MDFDARARARSFSSATAANRTASPLSSSSSSSSAAAAAVVASAGSSTRTDTPAVLITGATGTVGTALLAQLLLDHCCAGGTALKSDACPRGILSATRAPPAAAAGADPTHQHEILVYLALRPATTLLPASGMANNSASSSSELNEQIVQQRVRERVAGLVKSVTAALALRAPELHWEVQPDGSILVYSLLTRAATAVRLVGVPIDLSSTTETLAIPRQSLQTLVAHVGTVYHCAGVSIASDLAATLASDNSRAHRSAALLDAVTVNVGGTARLMRLLQTRFHRHIRVVVLSSAFVSAPLLAQGRQTTLRETLPPLPAAIARACVGPNGLVDVDAIDRVLSLSAHDRDLLVRTALELYPDLYTFSRALAEHVLAQYANCMSIACVRTTLIGPALSVPCAGWIDRPTLIASALLASGDQLVSSLPASAQARADIVPVDVAATALLKAGGHAVASQPVAPFNGLLGRSSVHSQLEFFHVACDPSRLVAWEVLRAAAQAFTVRQRKAFSAVQPPVRAPAAFAETVVYALRWYLTAGWSFERARGMLLADDWEEEAVDLVQAFHPAQHASAVVAALHVSNVDLHRTFIARQSPAWQLEQFWRNYLLTSTFGVYRHLRGVTRIRQISYTHAMDCFLMPVQPGSSGALSASPRMHVLRFGLRSRGTPPMYRNVEQRAPWQIRQVAFDSSLVQRTLTDESIRRGVPRDVVAAEARSILDTMSHNLRVTALRAMAMTLRGALEQLYRNITCDLAELDRLREAVTHAPVMLLPSHRSYLDFLIVSYVMWAHDLPLPAVAAGQDFMAMAGVSWFLRNSGAFFMRRSFGSDKLYWAVFSSYVQTIVINGDSPIEFFLEGTRSRTGKSLPPKTGLLSMVLDPFFDCRVSDVQMVPVGLSYERLFERDLYVRELLGLPKPKESTSGLLKVSSALGTDLGRIHVRFGRPVSTQEYNAALEPAQRIDRRLVAMAPAGASRTLQAGVKQQFAYTLGLEILRRQQLLHVFQPAQLLGALMLLHHHNVVFNAALPISTTNVKRAVGDVLVRVSASRPSVSLPTERLARELTALAAELTSRGCTLDWMAGEDAPALLVASLGIFPGIVSANLDRVESSVPDSLSLHLSSPEEVVNEIALANYRNQIMHVFIEDCLVALPLFALGSSRVSVEGASQLSGFLRTLLSREFLIDCPDPAVVRRCGTGVDVSPAWCACSERGLVLACFLCLGGWASPLAAIPTDSAVIDRSVLGHA
ncbi:peroxisomal acyl-CoA:dihydroxyacetonephosphate acyltransferase, variant [Capsaspora owczarzaki ATCC 30864]|uniref:Peroxisomal acyl-CoA:dihydroxyacetonephosphate acyltransferase, variant n=1 Tax=Capsaspora owczarzaki (strain ATCC 30864) TaxID=595528 RepID=A0A0D2WKV5_CAPO3|nr:peroxisomal acyl-CoA:dihydroxyacetonephosphate acyltransferase, variant [Capsaspora owczarzaki ATCC 30864]